jgi:3-oxoacid CoA-transferase subunit A
MTNKIYDSPAAALDGVLFEGMTIMSGGFGLSGNPESLIPEIRRARVKDLTVISNNAGAEGFGLWMLLETRQVARMASSYVGENKLFEQQYFSGELALEFNPQGTRAERIRAGGAGIPASYTKTGVGTVVAEGKPVEEFDGEFHVRKTARNFNPNMATAGKVTVVEVEEIDLTVLGAMEVSANGDIASRTVPGKMVKGISGAGVVDLIVTDLCVMACDKKAGGLTLREPAPGAALDEVIAKTGARFDAGASAEEVAA